MSKSRRKHTAKSEPQREPVIPYLKRDERTGRFTTIDLFNFFTIEPPTITSLHGVYVDAKNFDVTDAKQEPLPESQLPSQPIGDPEFLPDVAMEVTYSGYPPSMGF